MNQVKPAAAFLLIVCLVLSGGPIARSSEREPSDLTTTLRNAEPIVHLPQHVSAADGELSLFADYGAALGDHIVLYLVNRTALRLGIATQDFHPYVKLEAWDATHEWERAQKHHSSWCGNSYFHVPLGPGEFFRFLGYHPADGAEAIVRYRVYDDNVFVLEDRAPEEPKEVWFRSKKSVPLNLVSNVGNGRVRQVDIAAARSDDFGISFRSFANIRDLVQEPVTADSPYGSRSSAVEALGQFPTEESLALLRGFLSDADPLAIAGAMRGLARMGLKLEAAEKLYQELLCGDDTVLRRHATRALEARPITPELIQFAKGQLVDDDLYVRIAAMSVLGMQCIQDPEMKAYINSIYDDPDPKIQSIFETVLLPTCINHRERGRKGQFRRDE